MKTPLRSSLIVLALAGAGLPVAAQELPLSGAAYRVASQAYAAYDRGDFATASRQAAEAARLRPDVVRLRLLQVYALQKLGRLEDARRQARRALADGLQDPALPALAAEPAPARAAVRNPGAVPTTPSGAAGRAYAQAFALASEAYVDYQASRFAVAAGKAEQAFRQQTGQGDWAMLWVAALEDDGRLEEALQATDTALALGAPNRTDLQARQERIRREQAVAPAQQGYQALLANTPDAAVAPARRAVALAPESASHRLLLITALMLSERLDEAVQAATDALAQDAEDSNARVLRGYLQQRRGRPESSAADFDAVLAQDWLDPQQRASVRLLAVDAALAGGQAERARTLLAGLQADMPADLDAAARTALAEAVTERTRRLRALPRTPPPLTASNYPAPTQVCRDTPYGTQCELQPADLQGEASAAQRAYAAYGRQAYPEAIRAARQALQQAPDSAPLQVLLTTTLAAGNRAEQDEALQRLAQRLAATPDDAGALMQRGYLYQRRGQPGQALADFSAAEATGAAPPTVLLDRAYATANTGDNRQATALLRTAIDRADQGTLPLDGTQRYNTRSSIAALGREWGMSASAGYRGARQAASNLGGAAISTPGDAAFGTLEAFWRPPRFNTRHGMLEAYARMSGTLYDQGGSFESLQTVDPCTGERDPDARDRAERLSRSRSIAGWPSTVGALGLRYTFGRTGLSAGLERRQFLGTATRNGGLYPDSPAVQCRIQQASAPLNLLARYRLDDSAGGWMSYLTYGFYHGTGVRPDARQWWTVTGYAQAGVSWDDNRARFSVDALDASGAPSQSLLTSEGRLQRTQLFAAAELRLGRTYRFGAVQTRWTVNPYVLVAADWFDQRSKVRGVDYPGLDGLSFDLSDSNRSWSLGAGPGVNVRYWWREDRYNAARSYVDLGVQYRFALGGGDSQRAKGLFATATLYY